MRLSKFWFKTWSQEGKFLVKMWSQVGKTRGSLNSMINNSKNRREGFKVVVEDRWSLNSSGR